MRIGPRIAAFIFLICVYLSSLSTATAQSPNYQQQCIDRVQNATVHVPASVDTSLPNGTLIEPGDTLAVYTQGGTCAGYGVWRNGEGATFAAAGANPLETAAQGFSTDAPFSFELYDVSDQRSIEIGTGAMFASCETVGLPNCGTGRYKDGTFHQVARLEVDSPASLTRPVAVSDGWSFISIPVQSDTPLETILSTCSDGYTYSPGTGYTRSTQSPLPVGQGAAVRCSADTTAVTGAPTSGEIEVNAGWNLIGGTGDTVAVDAITSTPTGIITSTIFGIGSTGGYVEVSALRPGAGYWVKVAEDGVLNLTGTGTSTSEDPLPTPALQSALDDGTRLTFTDAAGHQSSLWLKEDLTDEEQARYELPPVPPQDMFDIRFSGGYRAASVASGLDAQGLAPQRQIEIQGVDFPLRVRVEAKTNDQFVQLANGSDVVSLSPEQDAAQIERATTELTVTVASTPQKYRLGKTRPNPIRNQAKVEYTLPEDTDVTIAVYDVLGRRVAQLVDSRKEAGVHQTRIDARTLASGKYIVRMRAGSFRKTRQLTVLR